MLPLSGAVTLSVPLPALKDKPTRRCSMSKECVGAPGRISTTEEMFAASGVETVNDPFHEMVAGTLVIAGRVASPPLELNKYAGL
jgi:hypothetical protein